MRHVSNWTRAISCSALIGLALSMTACASTRPAPVEVIRTTPPIVVQRQAPPALAAAEPAPCERVPESPAYILTPEQERAVSLLALACVANRDLVAGWRAWATN